MEENQETLVDHLTELRVRLIRSLIGVVVGFAVCFGFSELLFDIVRAPVEPFLDAGGLVFTGPMDKFLAHVKVSFLGGIIISCPFWLYQVWMFIAPGLYSHERKYSIAFISVGSILFIAGVCFVYFVVYRMAFDFLFNFGSEQDKAMITIDNYLGFFATTTVVFGCAFELPLILTLLGIAGVIDKKFLQEKRRYAIVLLAIVSAMITPPDAISMVMLMCPLYFLYEAGVIMVGIFGAKKASS